MNAIAIIISLIALVGAGFAFLRASSSHRILSKRIEKQKDRITILEERLRRVEGNASRGKKQQVDEEEPVRRNQPRQEQQDQHREREPRQKKQRERREQDRPLQERQQQDRPQRERPQPESQSQQADPQAQQQEDAPQGQRKRRDRDRRRGNEPREPRREEGYLGEQPLTETGPARLEFAQGDLLDELEQAAAGQQAVPLEQTQAVQPTPMMEEAVSDKKYAIIPEDGLIRQHQLQLRPDSDSYIEVDTPADGSNSTRYRFNLSGNQAFVISQGIDRLENAFAFEKPSNRMVSRIVQQGDGILTRVGNGWKIEEKARIDFR